MTAFAAAAQAAADVLFAHYAESGTYTPGAFGGTPVPVSVIRKREDPVIRVFGGAGARSPGWSVLLRQTDVPLRPHSDDRLTVGADSFVIRDVEEDQARLFWRCTLHTT